LLIQNERQLFDSVVAHVTDPSELAKWMIRFMRSVVENPSLKAQYDNAVIEAFVEYVRRKQFPQVVSREHCAFGCLTVEATRRFVGTYRHGLGMPPHFTYMVEPLGRTWFTDMSLLKGFRYDIPFDEAVNQEISAADRYWQTATEDAKQAVSYSDPEVLFENGARVVIKLS
jgi:hypothetical protein